ncbi:ATPase, partial [Acidianus sp. DSM 29099]|nr:ATPase [Acidianus sp. RZ1]
MSVKELMVDKSALLQGFSRHVEKGDIVGNVLIHRALLSQLERDAREGLISGEIALDEIDKLKEFSEKYLFSLQVVGNAG